jgi:DNA-directed RNA polymerase subunit beta'
VAQNVVITMHDCQTTQGIAKSVVYKGEEIERPLAESIRSPTPGQAALGINRLCYGMDRATGDLVEEGMAVGIIAARSVGEPGDRLPPSTCNIDGVASTIMEKNEARANLRGVAPASILSPTGQTQGSSLQLLSAILANRPLHALGSVGPKDRWLRVNGSSGIHRP